MRTGNMSGGIANRPRLSVSHVGGSDGMGLARRNLNSNQRGERRAGCHHGTV